MVSFIRGPHGDVIEKVICPVDGYVQAVLCANAYQSTFSGTIVYS